MSEIYGARSSDHDFERRWFLAALCSVCDEYGRAEREAIMAEAPLSPEELADHLRRIGLDVPDGLQAPPKRTERGNPSPDGRDALAAS